MTAGPFVRLCSVAVRWPVTKPGDLLGLQSVGVADNGLDDPLRRRTRAGPAARSTTSHGPHRGLTSDSELDVQR